MHTTSTPPAFRSVRARRASFVPPLGLVLALLFGVMLMLTAATPADAAPAAPPGPDAGASVASGAMAGVDGGYAPFLPIRIGVAIPSGVGESGVWPVDPDIVLGVAIGVVVFAILFAFLAMLVESALPVYSSSKLLGRDTDGANERRFHVYLEHEDVVRTVCQLSRIILALVAFAATIVGVDALSPSEFGTVSLLSVAIGLAIVGTLWLGIVNAVAPLWAETHPEGVLRKMIGVVGVSRSLFRPVLAMVHGVRVVVARLAGFKTDDDDGVEEVIKDIQQAVDEGEREGVFSKEERAMIERVIRFRRADAGEVMSARTDMITVGVESTITEALRLAYDHGHSRIPVYDGTPDKIVGVFYTRDLLGPLSGVDILNADDETKQRAQKKAKAALTALQAAATSTTLAAQTSTADGEDDGPTDEAAQEAAEAAEVLSALTLREIMRPPYFVPETKPLYTLLAELRQMKVSMAIVLDEYGGTAGLVTMEDILEEIVGDIQDEYDEEEAIRAKDDGTYILEARTNIDEINERLDLELPEADDYDTLGGYLFYRFGKVPTVGEYVDYMGYRFTVDESDERRIVTVSIRKLTPEERAESADADPSESEMAHLSDKAEGNGAVRRSETDRRERSKDAEESRTA